MLGACCTASVQQIQDSNHRNSLSPFNITFGGIALAGSRASLLEQILGCNTFDASPETHSLPKAFKGMQCGVSSTSQRDLSAAKSLTAHEVDILSGGHCRCLTHADNFTHSAGLLHASVPQP